MNRRSLGLGFSWRRAVGISAAKARLSRRIGIPLTRVGQERKLGHALGCALSGGGGAMPRLILLLACLGWLLRALR
jgi:hypothetical protein